METKWLINVVTVLVGCLLASAEDGKNGDSFITYKRLFLSKRAMHIEAVENIKKLDLEKRGKMINMIVDKLFSILETNIQIVTQSGFQPGDKFPEDEKLREAYAVTLENTMFFGDLALRFPDDVHSNYDSQRKWKIVLQQSMSILNSSQVLSTADQRVMNLAAQELNIIVKDPNFKNPFTLEYEREAREKVTREAERLLNEQKLKKKKKRKKRKREPRLSDEL